MKSFTRIKKINGQEYLYEITPYYDKGMCLAPTKMMRIDENPPRPEEIYNSSLISSYWEYARRRYYQA
ncbi:MAG: hypothetical protein WDA01_08710, partial [Methanothrix sp.]